VLGHLASVEVFDPAAAAAIAGGNAKRLLGIRIFRCGEFDSPRRGKCANLRCA